MILCNRNREQVLEITQQQLIIFPLIIARCAEATLRVLLCREHPRQGRCNQRRVIPSSKQKNRVRRRSFKLFVNTPLTRNVWKPTGTGSSRGPRLFRSYQTLQKGQHRVKRHHVRSFVRPSSDKKCCAKRYLLMLCTVLRRRVRLRRFVRRFADYLLGKEEV